MVRSQESGCLRYIKGTWFTPAAVVVVVRSWCVEVAVVVRSGSAEVVVCSGSVDVVPAGQAQDGSALPALQCVLDHILPLVV